MASPVRAAQPRQGRLLRGAALLCCTVALSSSACRDGRDRVGEGIGPRRLERKGVRALIVEQRKREYADAIPGDLVLLGPELRVRVDGPNRSEPRAIVIASGQGPGGHEWEAQQPLFVFGGSPHEMRVERLELRMVGDRPAIHVRGTITLGETRLFITRVLRIADVGTSLRVTTRVSLEGGVAPRDLHVVERPIWGGESPVAPLTGPLVSGKKVAAEWLGREMEGKAVAIGAYAGEVNVTGRQVDHGRVDLLRFTDVELPTRATRKGQWVAEAVISTAPSGLGDAVRRFGWTRGKPFVEAEVKLAVTPPGASVLLLSSTFELVSSGRPDRDRRVLLPVPERALGQRLLAVALARGREASERVPLTGPPYEPLTLTIPVGGKLEVSAKRAATGEYLPVRIRVLPRETTPAPDLGPDWMGGGALDTVIAETGRASIPLPAGYYRVLVTHGPEYTMHDERIELDVAESARVDALLEHVVDPGPWVACDFHVHAAPSADSEVSLTDRVASLVAEGIAFAVPTDHNHVTDYTEAVQLQPLRGLLSVPGVEVTTIDPLYGHFNVFPFPLDPEKPGNGAPEVLGVEPADLFAALHAVVPRPIVQVNHPRIEGGIGYLDAVDYDPAAGHGNERYSDDYDAVEVWNGFDLGRFENVERMLSEWLGMIARGRRVIATGSSDSHTIRSENAGYPRTYVRPKLAGATGAEALLGGLREGRAFVTSGPFLSVLVDGAGPGDTVQVQGGTVAVDVTVQIPGWMAVQNLRVYLGGQLVQRVPLLPANRTRSSPDGTRYARKLRIPITRSAPLVIAVEGDKELRPFIARGNVRPFAFINPIWLEVGDGPN